MTTLETFMETAGKGMSADPEDAQRVAEICDEIRGYSTGAHYAFFKTILANPAIEDVLILGVYHGRDIAFMLDVLKRAGREDVRIVGVDKFSDTPCADWPEGTTGKSWQDAGFGPPPDYEQAVMNLGGNARFLQLIESTDEAFLASTAERFDFIYLDTSHDYETVMRQVKQARRVCRLDTLIAGDDYSDEGTWGVQRAVRDSFFQHTVFAEWIWISHVSLLQNTEPASIH